MQRRNQQGLTKRELAETEQMEAAGFEWNPSTGGMGRWDHWPLQLTAIREHWMRDADWDKRRAEKIVEASRLRRYDDLPLGSRFRLQRHIDTRRRVYVKLGGPAIVEWRDSKTHPIAENITTLSAVDRTVVELFEPFDNLPPGELEKLPEFPEVWTALADWHSCQSAMAEAADYIESSKWHDAREKACKERSKELLQKLENG